jgi:SAM-dependent methyltransferase
MTDSRCDACGSAELRVLYRQVPDWRHRLGAFDVLECRRCGTGRTSPRVSEAEIGRFYPPGYASFAGDPGARGGVIRLAGNVIKAPALLRYGVPRTPPPPRPGARVLDVGSGSGERLAALAAAGWDVSGLEPSAGAAALGEERHAALRGRVTVGRAEDAAFPDASFDMVVMEHVVEHLHSPGEVLDRARRWLHAGGVLELALPNFGCVERRVFGRHWFGLDLPRHLNHFTARSIRDMLTARGFAVERMRPEVQAATLAGSVRHLLAALRRRAEPDRPGTALYYLAMPIAATLQAAGHRPTLVITARAQAG